VAKAAGKQPELNKRPPLSERALAARRMNAQTCALKTVGRFVGINIFSAKLFSLNQSMNSAAGRVLLSWRLFGCSRRSNGTICRIEMESAYGSMV
jgi:hypothetical protein